MVNSGRNLRGAEFKSVRTARLPLDPGASTQLTPQRPCQISLISKLNPM
jgi:hypothetical protein